MFWLSGMAVAALLVVYGLVQGLRAHVALRWPYVNGRIVRKEILQPDPDADKYVRDFAYTYEVAGRTHTGSRVTLLNDLTHSGTEAWLRTPLVRFEAGQAVKVFYDPAESGSAILSKAGLAAQRLHAALFFAMLLGGILVAIAAAPNRLQSTLQAPDFSEFFSQLDRTLLAWGGVALTLAWLVWRLSLPLRMAALYKAVQARVIESRVEYTRGSNSSSRANQAVYQPYVEFEYEEGGVVYHGNRLAWDPESLQWSAEKGAKKYHEGFQVGQSLTALVHRLDPATSVVDGRLSWLHLVSPLLVLVVMGGMVWLAQTHPAKHATTPDHPAATSPAAGAQHPAATGHPATEPKSAPAAADEPGAAPKKAKESTHKPTKHKRHDK